MNWIPPFIAVFEKISSRSKPLARLYARPYKKIVENEIRLAGLNKDDLVINIGCGAVPFTAVHIAALTGARVCAIDCDPAAAKMAARCVRKFGLEEKITVLAENGCCFTGCPFTAAVVALQAAPKEQIFQLLRQNARLGARLVFRLPSPGYADHYDRLSADIPADDSAAQPMRTFDRSVLFLQKSLPMPAKVAV